MSSKKMIKQPKKVPKRKSNHTENKDEFFVLSNKVGKISPFEEKIERMYQVRMDFEEDEVEGGRWLVLEGESEDRRNAKNYIKALSDPAEVEHIQLPSSVCTIGDHFTDPAFLEKIEKQTNAVIKPLKEIAKFEINGTELAVTLAMSQMEELAESILRNSLQTDDSESILDESNESTPGNSSSSRLSNQLERALSQHSDGLSSVNDYLHAPPSIQRVLVNCLQESEDMDDIDDDLLFGDEVDKGKEIGGSSGKVSQLTSKYDSIDIDGEVGTTSKSKDKSPGVSALADKMTETTISKPTANPFIVKQLEYLRSFGSSVGYGKGEVEKALEFVDEKTRPSDFLDLLSSVKSDHLNHKVKSDDSDVGVVIESDSDDDVVILETETIDLTNNDKKKKPFTEKSSRSKGCIANTEMTKGARTDPMKVENATNSQLLDDYLMDFFQEGGNCSVDELKKKNAERQQMLKKMMSSNENTTQPNAAKGTTATANLSNTETKTGSKKKKKNKKQQQQPQNQKNQATKEKQMDLPHDKQFRLESNERTYSSDGEQTCVLRVWSGDKSDQGGIMVNSDPLSNTPKRKQSKHNEQSSNYRWSGPNSQNQPQASSGGSDGTKRGVINLYPGGPVYQQPHPVEVLGKENQWQKAGPVPQQQYSHRPLPPVPSGDDRRYIVIDGSNVAMTHGNGKHFSCKGLRVCVDYFKQRGHQKITVFVPHWRHGRPTDQNQIIDQHILEELKDEEILVFTPSRRIRQKLVASYDDRFVLELAEAEDAVIVSNDQYRDLMHEKHSWRKIIEERLLMFSFVKDHFMPPNDPLGQYGPCLDDFLKNTPPQPTTGYNGPFTRNFPANQPGARYTPNQQGAAQRPVYPPYKPNLGQQQQQVRQKGPGPQDRYQKQGQGQNYRAPAQHPHYNQPDCLDGPPPDQTTVTPGPAGAAGHNKAAWGKGQQKGQGKGQGLFGGKGQGSSMLCPRTEAETQTLYKDLKTIFPEPHQDETVRNVLENHERERDLTKLTNYCMSVLFN